MVKYWETLVNSESEDATWEIIHDSEKKEVTLLFFDHDDFINANSKIKMSYDQYNDLLEFCKVMNRKTKEEKKETIYLKCWKCGGLIMMKNYDKHAHIPMCTYPMAVRTSGICGGSFTEKSTKEEFEKAQREYEEKQKTL